MTCEHCEEKIIKQMIDSEVEAHLHTCESCRMFHILLSTSTLSIQVPNDEINDLVKDAIHEANIRIKKRDILSLLLFVLLAGSLLLSIAYWLTDATLIVLRYYWMFLSALMPISLPVLTVIIRKVALR